MHSGRLVQVWLSLAFVCVGLSLAGCVERRLTITTKPAGAVVYLNDEEVGTTPVEVRFTWYGDYDIAIRKSGYETLRTHRRIDPPIYEWPVFDVVSELLLPVSLRDERHWHFELTPQHLPDKESLLKRAEEFRAQALYQPSGK